jgi:hypothetical protein
MAVDACALPAFSTVRAWGALDYPSRHNLRQFAIAAITSLAQTQQ